MHFTNKEIKIFPIVKKWFIKYMPADVPAAAINILTKKAPMSITLNLGMLFLIVWQDNTAMHIDAMLVPSAIPAKPKTLDKRRLIKILTATPAIPLTIAAVLL